MNKENLFNKDDLKKYIEMQNRNFLSNKEKYSIDYESLCSDLLADNWDGLCKKIENYIGSLEDKKILDVGSGSGGKALSFSLKEANTVGIDPNFYAIKVSSKEASQYKDLRAAFLQGLGEDLPFKDNTFDLVTSFNSLEHTKEINKVISEIFRVLKKGGYLYCELPNNIFPFEGHYRIFLPLFLPKGIIRIYLKIRGFPTEGLSDLNFISRRDIFRRFDKIGFKEIRDTNIDYIIGKILHPESVETESKRTVLSLFKKIGMSRLLSFVLVKLSIYPAIHIIAKKVSEDG
ncbi:MAG: class I SAM-dependent methyltransferase [Candidatus Omnitrophota bacterium]